MTDNIQNDDEYQFADLDAMGPESGDEGFEYGKPANPVASSDQAPKKDIRRNALIVVAVVILAMVVYKFMGSLFHKDVAAIKSSRQAEPVTQPAPVQEITPVEQIQNPPSTDVSDLSQKLSNMEASQQSLRSDVNGLNSQLSTVNTSISSLNNKLDALNQTLMSLSTRMEQQSTVLARMIAQQAKPKKMAVVKRRVIVPRIQYAIQAIIPGRAWLIAQNGSTLTVRAGTIVPGLGTVRVIDPNLGRVVMSTGQVIRFSQQDS